MKRRQRLGWGVWALVIAAALGSATGRAAAGDPNWASFRGSNAAGVAEGYPLPVAWNVETGENIRWKTPIPGLAHSSPIIWGDRLFVTSAVSADPKPYLRVGLYGESPDHPENVDHDFRVFCLDKKSGKILWEKTAYRGIPKTKRHIKATHANCTPATDGRHVVALFGSEGLYCYDFEGKLLWQKDIGYLDAGPSDARELQWGFASSPIIHDGRVIVFCAVRNASFVAAFDVQDGRELWRTPRETDPCWGTPTVHVGTDRTQIITNGYQHIGGYDFNTGKELWWMRGRGDVPVPTPVVANDLIYITNAHGGDSPVYAVRPTATGDITLADGATTNEYIAWSNLKIGNYMQTPLVYSGLLYCCRDSGILACYDATTGAKHYRERLADGVGFTASPVAGDGKVYFTSEEGDVHVVGAGPQFMLMGQNRMGEICMATPAISEGNLLFRTQNQIIAVGPK
jgi:outer membrane protein assembly factor BamB